MMAATEGVDRLQMKSKSSIPCTARGCIPLASQSVSLALTLYSSPGYVLDEASSLVVEEVVFEGGERARGSSEAGDVVVGRQVPAGAHDDSRAEVEVEVEVEQSRSRYR